MGDSSSSVHKINSEMLQNHLENIKKLSPQPKFLFFLGDMIYGGAEVTKQLEDWKSIVKGYYPIEMFYPVLGNHDESENAFSEAFSYLPNEQLPGYKRTVYYIDYYNTRIIILNTNRLEKNGGYAVSKEQRLWLENTLRSSRKKYNFVMLHVPAFPTGHHYGECLDASPEDLNALWEIFDKFRVTAVFSGHEHNYCRRLVDQYFAGDGNLKVKNPIYNIITGGAGTSLNSHKEDIRNVKVGPLGMYHYTVVDINDQEVTLQAYDQENNLIDSCILSPIKEGLPSSSLTDILIPLDAEWKYLDDGTDQGFKWRENVFDDSAWKSGYAELGYGDGGEATIVSYGPNIHRKYITTYFRRHFAINNASLYKDLIIRLQRDDGAVVYLNGKEVYRTNMPNGDITSDTLASKALNGDDEKNFEKVTIDGRLLRNGDNVIAVEIHQASASSSDISFNLQLIGNKKIVYRMYY